MWKQDEWTEQSVKRAVKWWDFAFFDELWGIQLALVWKSGPCVVAKYGLVLNGGSMYMYDIVGQAHPDVVKLDNEYEIV